MSRILWIAFGEHDRVLGEVTAASATRARLEAWARWGSSVARVQSRVSWEIAQTEASVPPARRHAEEEDGA